MKKLDQFKFFSLHRANEYYENNKEVLREKAKNYTENYLKKKKI